MTSKDKAVWGTVTLAAPQLVEWQIEGTGIPKQGSDLGEFLRVISRAPADCAVVLRLNFLLSL